MPAEPAVEYPGGDDKPAYGPAFVPDPPVFGSPEELLEAALANSAPPPVLFPNGFVLQFGVSATAGAGTGGILETGFALGIYGDEVVDHGTYITVGGGAYINVGAGVGPAVTLTPGTLMFRICKVMPCHGRARQTSPLSCR